MTESNSPSIPPSASGMDGDESCSTRNGKDLSDWIGWETLSILNGRSYFLIIHDIGSCFKCWSPSSYYSIMGSEEKVLMNGTRMCSLPGCKPSNVYITNVNDSSAFYVKFVTVGLFPVLKRAEIRDNTKKRFGIIAEVSKILSMVSFRIQNDLEGGVFHVKAKLNLIKGHDFEIKASDGELLATVNRAGPTHTLQILESNIVTGCRRTKKILYQLKKFRIWVD